MTSLKNKILLSLIWLLFSGCQILKREVRISSEVVKILKTDEKKELIVIEANTSRIIHECYFLNASDENKWRHHYFLYVLNEKNEVITIMNPNNQSIDNCMRQFKKIDKILKTSRIVRFCAKGIFKYEPTSKDVIYTDLDFGKLGKFKDTTYDSLVLDRVCNEKNCQGVDIDWPQTCDKLY